MTPALSIDIKRRIIQLRQEGSTLREIASRLKVSVGVVHKTLEIHEEYGQYTDPSKKRTGRPQTLDDDDERYLASLLESNPSMYLDEIKQKLEVVRKVSVSMATISRFLRSRDFTRKALARQAAEANEAVRTCYQTETAKFTDPDYFVFIDESHVDRKTAHRSNGWSLIGVSPVERSTFLRGVRHSILPALTTEGIVALEIFEGSVNKARFIQFLRDNVAPQLNPFPGKKSIVVVDNCSIHHDPQVKELIENECSAKLMYLPAYSPDLNPIEEAFSCIKASLRRNNQYYTDADKLPWLVHEAAASITPDMALGWFADCGYVP